MVPAILSVFFVKMAVSMNFANDAERRPHLYKDILHPFDEFDELVKRFRFDRAGTGYLSNLVRGDLEWICERSRPIPVEISVMVSLRYLATADRQLDVADTFRISQPTVSRIVTAFVTSMNRHLGRFVQFPVLPAAVQQCQHGFYDLAGFPRVVSCVDGTHIQFAPPSEREQDYLNRKGYHSINVQVMCDHQHKFTNVVARWPGSTHDFYSPSKRYLGTV